VKFEEYEANAYRHLSKKKVTIHMLGVTLWVSAMTFFFSAGMAITNHALGISAFLFMLALFTVSYNPLAQFINKKNVKIDYHSRIAALCGFMSALAWLLAYFNATYHAVISFNYALIGGFLCIMLAMAAWNLSSVPARKFRFLSYLQYAPGALGVGVHTGVIIRGLTL